MVAKKSKTGKLRPRGSSSKRWLFPVVFGGLALVLGGFLLYGNITMFVKRSSLNEKANELDGRIGALSAKEQKLTEIRSKEQTAAYQEKILREQGLYKKRGEEVVMVIQEERPLDAPEALPVQGESARPRVWWDPLTW